MTNHTELFYIHLFAGGNAAFAARRIADFGGMQTGSMSFWGQGTKRSTLDSSSRSVLRNMPFHFKEGRIVSV